jgi:hypothetical protein
MRMVRRYTTQEAVWRLYESLNYHLAMMWIIRVFLCVVEDVRTGWVDAGLIEEMRMFIC